MAQEKALQTPSRFQVAEVRLQSAVAHLEEAIQGAKLGDAEERVIALEAEIQDLKLKNANLISVNKKMCGSLDRIIDNLRSALNK